MKNVILPVCDNVRYVSPYKVKIRGKECCAGAKILHVVTVPWHLKFSIATFQLQ